MIVSIIVAYDQNRGIGKDNTIPWKLAPDMKRFKEKTTGHHMITGRKNFESIGRALPERISVIVTRQKDFPAPPRCVVVHSLSAAVEYCKGHVGEKDEVFVIGGGEIYKQALESGIVDRMYLTEIADDFDCDVFFPEVDMTGWEEISSDTIAAGGDVEFSFRYIDLERV